MTLSREGDRREGILLRQSKGWFQVAGMGHEALAALAYAVRSDDYLFPYYRDRALMLARGVSNYDLALAFFAKRDSSSGGRQMPSHYSARHLNAFSVCTPTGGELLPACGAAWGMQLEHKDTVVVATVGDAASRQGEFFESLAFASQEKLPIVFVVEDNKFGISTPTKHLLPMRLGILCDALIQHIDARDPDIVYQAGLDAITFARQGGGPTILWADIDRLCSHTSSDDHRVYRSAEEIAEMNLRDPIDVQAAALIASGELTAEGWEATRQAISDQVDEDYRRAEREADPSPAQVYLEVMGPEPEAVQPPIQGSERMTMVQALNQSFRAVLEKNPKAIFFGEDVEDPKGGVFGLTKGLSSDFPAQVFNSPLAECTIMGLAVGLAAYGWKPIFELQFIDFAAPGWNQITTNMSSLRWRSNGTWKCPCIIYSPYGAYLPGGGIWHSQANEASLAHWPGMRIVIPSTPEDAAGLFWTAMDSEDPTWILIPKHLFRKPVEVREFEPVPFGKARVVQEGSDVTMVAWGNTIEVAVAAAAQAGVSAEVIDLRSIVPLDYDTIVESLSKTGRLVVVQEDIRTASIGQAIVTEIVGVPERFNLLLSPPQLVSRGDVHIGFNPILEYAALPDVERVVRAIQVVME